MGFAGQIRHSGLEAGFCASRYLRTLVCRIAVHGIASSVVVTTVHPRAGYGPASRDRTLSGVVGGRNEPPHCELAAGLNRWFYRFELAGDYQRYLSAEEEIEMTAAHHFDVLEVWCPENLQATGQGRAEGIPLRVDRCQPYAGGKAVVVEVAQER